MNKKESFFKKVIASIKNFERYPEFAIKRWGEVISYLIKLLIIFTTIVSITYAYQLSKQMKEILAYISNDIPNFSLENDKLQFDMQESFIIKYYGDNLVIISNEDKLTDENISIMKDKNISFAFLKDSVFIKSDLSNEILEYKYSLITKGYGIEKLDKQELLSYFNKTNLILLNIGFFIISFIYLFLINIISVWLDIILLALFGYITSLLFMRIRIRFCAMCKIAIHSLTLPIILNIIVVLIQTFTSFRVKYFETMYMTIAYIYVIATLLMIKSDVIKNQQELLKIIEEQERVKRQLEEKDNEKEEKNNKDKKEDKKENDNNNEDETQGQEPQGHNA